jgi:DnaJ-class molecular chaperone
VEQFNPLDATEECPACRGKGVTPMGYRAPHTGKEAVHLCGVCEGRGRTTLNRAGSWLRAEQRWVDRRGG